MRVTAVGKAVGTVLCHDITRIVPGESKGPAFRKVGLPGCVMYHRTSVFDLLVPRLVAGERLAREDIVDLGHGGLCAMCPDCRYPACGFGKS